MPAVSHVDDIAQGEVDPKADRDNLIPPGRDTLNFHVRLRAVSYHDTPLVLRAACLSNRKYRVSSREEAGGCYPSSGSTSDTLLPSIIPSSTHTAPALITKNFDPTRIYIGTYVSRNLRRGSRRKEEEDAGASHRGRQFAVVAQ